MSIKITRDVTTCLSSADGGKNNKWGKLDVEVFYSEEFGGTVVKGLTSEGVLLRDDLKGLLEDVEYVHDKEGVEE